MNPLDWWKNHGTKILGFAQVTIAVLATATDVFTPLVLKALVLASGLLTAWRGFMNSASQNQP